MKTSFYIDAELLESVEETVGESTKNGAVNAALKEYLRRKHILEWMATWGRIIVDDCTEQVAEANEKRRAFLDSLWDDAR